MEPNISPFPLFRFDFTLFDPSIFIVQYILELSQLESFPANQTWSFSITSLSVLLTGLTTNTAYYTRVAATPPSFPGVSLPPSVSLPML